MRPRIGFLPWFFVTLVIVVAVIAYVRIRSYEPATPQEAVQGTVAPADPGIVTESLSAVTQVPVAKANATPAPPTTMPVLTPTAPQRSTATSIEPAVSPTPATIQSGGSATALRKPPPRPAPQVRSEQSVSTPATSAPPSHTDEPIEEEETNDPTSDNLPPRLVSIEFTPAEVQDGQETILKIEAIDELAGMRSVSGTILAPSGAVQGFACTREPNTNRYQSRILVPKAASDGVWRVNYLALTDLANNTASLTLANALIPPSASFRVMSAESDSRGPTLRSVSLERRSMQSGEKNRLTVQADDDKSGVQLVSGVFQSPSRAARIGFICRARTGDLFDCEVTAPVCADCGDWRLEQVQLQDKANNMTTVRADNPILAPVLLDISSSQCDATPPAVENVTIDRRVVSNAAQTTVSVFVSLTDDGCGIQSVSGQVTGPPGPEGAPQNSFSFTQDRDARTWVGRFNVPVLAAKGTWRVSWLQVLDRGRNLRTYSQNDPVLSGATFVVE